MSTSFPPIQRDVASAPFFDAAAAGSLALRRCDNCSAVRGPEVPMCTSCLSESCSWFASAGTGTIVSWVVLHGRADAEGITPPPRIVATVELEEGPWMVSALLGVEPENVAGGQRVTVAFEQPENSEPIPVFRPL